MSSRASFLLCFAGLAAGVGAGVWLRPAPAVSVSARSTELPGEAPLPTAAEVPPVAQMPQRISAELSAGPASCARLQLLFMQWFEQDPNLWPRFQELVKQHPERAADLTTAFFTAWAWKDCDAACTAITSSALQTRSEAIIAAWHVACALGHPAGARLEAGIYVKDWSSLERLAARNVPAALTLSDGLRDSSNPPASLLALARGWAASDGAAAAAWAAGLKENGDAVFREACLAWERKNPGALQRADGTLRDRIKADAVLAQLTAEKDPAAPLNGNPAAVLAARQNPFATMQDVLAQMQRTAAAGGQLGSMQLFTDSAGEWSAADPQAALRELPGMPAGAARDLLTATLLARWEASDPAAAASFAKDHGLALASPQTEFFQAAWKKVEGLSLDEALRVSLPAGQPPDWNALSAAVSRRVNDDPAAATAFLTQHMEDITRDEAWRMVLGNTLSEWSQVDLNAAVEYAAALPAGPVRERAIGAVMQELTGYDPEAALTWMAGMTNPDSGSTSLRQVVGDLQQRMGRFGARRAIERSALPEPLKQELIKSIP